MNISSEKSFLKKEIDKVEDENVLKAIKTLLDYANTQNDSWNDKDFVSDLKQRSADFKSGKTKKYSWEETKKAARKK